MCDREGTRQDDQSAVGAMVTPSAFAVFKLMTIALDPKRPIREAVSFNDPKATSAKLSTRQSQCAKLSLGNALSF
jgi:hypothetical protein